VVEALRKLAYSHPNTAAELEPELRHVASEYGPTDTIRVSIEKAQEYMRVPRVVTDISSLHHLAVTNVDLLPRQLDQIRTQLSSNNETKQRKASEAARKLAYSYPDWANDVRPELQQLQREYGVGNQIAVNARKAESYIDDRATGTKQPLSGTQTTTDSVGGDTNVHTPSPSGDTEVYTDDSAGDTQVYTAETSGDVGTMETIAAPEFEANFCPECGVDLSALDGGTFCPHCGNELPPV
jgi:hypothetical protein